MLQKSVFTVIEKIQVELCVRYDKTKSSTFGSCEKVVSIESKIYQESDVQSSADSIFGLWRFVLLF